ILAISTRSGEVRELMRVSPPQEAYVLMWAPDNRSVFLRVKVANGKPLEIWRAPLQGEPHKVTDVARIGPVTVHPDGRQIAYHAILDAPPAVDAKRELWVLENSLSALK